MLHIISFSCVAARLFFAKKQASSWAFDPNPTWKIALLSSILVVTVPLVLQCAWDILLANSSSTCHIQPRHL